MPTSIALTTQPTLHLPRRTSDNSASIPTTHCRLGTTLSLRICELILAAALRREPRAAGLSTKSTGCSAPYQAERLSRRLMDLKQRRTRLVQAPCSLVVADAGCF